MKIKFSALQKQGDNPEPKKVEFEADATYEEFIDDEDNDLLYHVYMFKEPKANEPNRIEINEKKINIFTGATTLQMILNEKTPNSYLKVDGKKFILSPLLKNVSIGKNKKTFDYALFSNNDDSIGDFSITIEEIVE